LNNFLLNLKASLDVAQYGLGSEEAGDMIKPCKTLYDIDIKAGAKAKNFVNDFTKFLNLPEKKALGKALWR
jgi:hypothetical protein